MFRLVLLGLAPALLACHVILPLGRNAQGEDGPAPEVSVLDAGERPLTGEAGFTDIDACNEDQALLPSVAGCDPGCTVGEDCDGLPDYRDYYKSYCSRLVYEETFGADPGADWDFEPSSGADWVWRCGRLDQRGVDSSEKWALARESEKTLPGNGLDYLVEARFQLGAPGDATDPHWGVGIGAWVTVNSTDKDFIVCELWVDPDATRRPAVDPDVRVDVRKGGKSTYGALQNAPTQGVEGKDGETYILQMWITQEVNQFNPSPPCETTPCPGVMCVLYDDKNPLRGGYFNLVWGAQYKPTTTGVVGFRTVNRAASFDYLRVFALSNP